MKLSIAHIILTRDLGTYLWSLFRKLSPKQSLTLVSEQTTLQETLNRIVGQEQNPHSIVARNKKHGFLAAQSLDTRELHLRVKLAKVNSFRIIVNAVELNFN